MATHLYAWPSHQGELTHNIASSDVWALRAMAVFAKPENLNIADQSPAVESDRLFFAKILEFYSEHGYISSLHFTLIRSKLKSVVYVTRLLDIVKMKRVDGFPLAI